MLLHIKSTESFLKLRSNISWRLFQDKTSTYSWSLKQKHESSKILPMIEKL